MHRDYLPQFEIHPDFGGSHASAGGALIECNQRPHRWLRSFEGEGMAILISALSAVV
jgi:hypothetical protein